MSLLAYIHWSVNPELFHLGPLAVRWYGVLFALGFFCGFYIVQWMYRVEHKNENNLNSLLIYMVLGALVGARLGHCFFYEPDYYLKHPLEILAIWEGGLASHGGAIGILIALYFYSRRHPDEPYLWVLDRIVVPTALGACFIRLGNLFNSEILGTPAQVPWAFIFQRIDYVPRHPVQLYESICYLLIFVLLIAVYRQWRAQTPRGFLLGLFFVTVFTARFFLEFIKQRQADYEQNFPISVGQWLSIPFVIFGLFLIWRSLHSEHPKRQGHLGRENPATT